MVNTTGLFGTNMPAPHAFFDMVNDLTKKTLARQSIPRKEYEKFCNEYIFDVLKHNEPFGMAFCRHFKLGDYMLSRVYKQDIMKCKELIEESGYINDTRSN